MSLPAAPSTSRRRAHLAAALLAGALSIFLVALAVMHMQARRSEERNEVHVAAGAVSVKVASTLDNMFERSANLLFLATQESALRHYFDPAESDAAREASLRDIDENLKSQHFFYQRAVRSLCVLTATGREISCSLDGKAAAVHTQRSRVSQPGFRAAMQLAMPGQVALSRPYRTNGDWVIGAASPVRRGARIVGVLQFEIRVSGIAREIAKMANGHEVAIIQVAGRGGGSSYAIADIKGDKLGVMSKDPYPGRFGPATEQGAFDQGGDRVVFSATRRQDKNANRWHVATSMALPPDTVTRGLSFVSIALLLSAVTLMTLALGVLVLGQRELHRRARTDVLTGLSNRAGLLEDLAEACARASADAPSLLLFLDLDGFKAYNDRFGHLAGDALLERLGTALTNAFADSGHTYRLGGDEFCVLLEDSRLGDEAAVERARFALTEHGDGFSVTASAGVARIPHDARDATAAMRLADQRMYAQKRSRTAAGPRQAKDALLSALGERDPIEQQRAVEVSDLSLSIANDLRLPDDQIERLTLVAELHNIGKMALPEDLLSKPGPLTDEESEFVRRHPVIGQRIVCGASSLADIGPMIRATHERFDGRGYPDGLARDEIPLQSRIVAVCAAYSAMRTDRPHAAALTAEGAVEEIARGAGGQFDPQVVAAFLRVVRAEQPSAPDLCDAPSSNHDRSTLTT